MTTENADAIRALNDQLRQNLSPNDGTVLITPGVAALDVDGRTIFFKIDYFDPTLTCHSSDPGDPTVTHRVITIMLAEEY